MNGAHHFMALPMIASKVTLLLAAAWLAHLLLSRRHPALRIALWRAAALGILLIPIVHALGPRVEVPVATATFERIAAPLTASPQPSAPAPSAVGSVVAPSTSTPPSLWSILVAIYVLGAAMVIARMAWSGLQLAGALQRTDPAPMDVQRRAVAVARRLGSRADFAVRVGQNTGSPYIAGWLRPTLVIPADVASSGERELDAVLAHEIAHHKGGDHLWTAVVQISRAAFWFHPMAWPMIAAHRTACEERCDRIAAGLDGDVEWYSALLASVALKTASVPAPPATIPMLSGSEILGRLRCLARNGAGAPLHPAWRFFTISVCAGTIAAAGMVTLRAEDTREASAANSSEGAYPDVIEAPPELLERLMQRSDPALRQGALDEILAMLKSGDSLKRGQALVTIGRAHDLPLDRSAFLEPARACLLDPNPRVRIMALLALESFGGDESDLPAVAAFCADPNAEVRGWAPMALFALAKSSESAELRDALLLTLLSDPSNEVVTETLRASWGNEVGSGVEARIIELSKSPDANLVHDAVYFGLSTRPVKSMAAAERLVEIVRDPKVGGRGNTGDRAMWGLTHWAVAEEAKPLVLAALKSAFEDSRDPQYRSGLLHGMAKHGGEAEREFIRNVAENEESRILKDAARQLLDRM